MTATGNEAVSIAQTAKALGIEAQTSGATGDESVRLRQLKMVMDSYAGGEQGSVQISYGGNSNANFYFVDAEGIYQSLKNPSSIAVSIPAIIGIVVNPKDPRNGNNAWVDNVSGGSVLAQERCGVGLVKSCVCVVCITESVASISIN